MEESKMEETKTTMLEQFNNESSVKENVRTLNVEVAFKTLAPDEQKEVMALSEAIDVTELEKVMSYGSEVLKRTFDQCGKFLKSEVGSDADQEVIKRVEELAKKASESYEDFELVIQEPNFLEKLLLKLSSSRKNNRTKKIQNRAVSNYRLLSELKESCEIWLDILKKSMGDITYSEMSDSENVYLLEKYIIAGEFAKKRVENELQQIQENMEETGLRTQSQKYDALKEGYDIFLIKLENLKKSRVMYYLSLAQLNLTKKSNRNVQISISTQSSNCITLIGQQMRNAVLDAKNREVIEGQKALVRLSDEMIKDVSHSIGVTSENAEKLLYYGICNVDAAKDAIKTVISGCDNVKKIAEEMLPKMQSDTEELNALVEELRPYIDASSSAQPPSKVSAIKDTKNLKF